MPAPTGSVSDCVDAGAHDRMRSCLRLWHEGVIEIGAMDDGRGGALIGGNCKKCMSTIWRHVDLPAEPRVRGNGDAPALCECQRVIAQCDCARLFGVRR